MSAPAETVTAPSRAALEMIDRLIAVPTVSRDSNLGVIEIARDHLVALGLKPHLVYDSTQKKANLFCTLADDAAASAKRSFDAGVASSLDVLDANDRLYQADVGLADARARLGMARVALARPAGEG